MVSEGHNMRQGRHPTILLRATLGGHAIFVLPKGHATFVVYYLPVPGPPSPVVYKVQRTSAGLFTGSILQNGVDFSSLSASHQIRHQP
jgi:hypothetical protein